MSLQILTLAQAQTHWWQRQLLTDTAPAERALTEVVSRIGWIPLSTLVSAPLALFARRAIESRATLDQALCHDHSLVIVPGPRGLTWLTSAFEAPLLRAFAVADLASREARIAASVPLTAGELDQTREALRASLSVPQSVDSLRARLPAVAKRSLGDAGKRNGTATVGALVLRQLWSVGEVMRVPPSSRADDPTTRWQIDPMPRTTPTAAEAVSHVASRWLQAFGPAPIKLFANAFGLAVGRAKAAFEALNAREVIVQGIADPCWVPHDFVAPEAMDLPARILPVRDPLTDIHLQHLAGPTVAKLLVSKQHGVGATAIFRGQILGGWSYDEGARRGHARWMTANVPAEAARAIEEELARVADFIASELGAVPLHTVIPQRSATALEASLSL
ncbi:MAG: crosslink repair DNA glycosylase YcaQ family protein [Deltaproteobacteria bacterium]|nr:crosslink repair DNA glycosylase YcaQ family protein [Deltaproteobacteria bacterium]